MTARRTVVALGGNAFERVGEPLTMEGQFRFAREALLALRPLLVPPRELVLVHGNGPQVGHMLVRVERALGEAYAIPLEVCVAESEGELGYVLLQTLHNVLGELGARRPIASLLTQVVVRRDDPAFATPTKPIGPYYDATRASELRGSGFAVTEVPGRGFRRVVPSPEPIEIVDVDVVERLLDAGALVIAAGGGGVPVVREGDRFDGVDAVIDKDLAAALLGAGIGATELVILTGVPAVFLDFGTELQRPLRRVTPEEGRRHAAFGHFPPGSMGPKMEAACRFASIRGRRALICDPQSLSAALEGNGGTIVETK